jgi:HEAT repeat protein
MDEEKWKGLKQLSDIEIEAVARSLDDESHEKRCNAFVDLITIGKPAVPALINALKNGTDGVRSSAANALGTIGDISAVPALIDALKNENEEVRKSATWALGNLLNILGVYNVEEIQKLEDDLFKALAEFRDRCSDKRKVLSVEIHFSILKSKIVGKKNELAKKKDILLPGKPKLVNKGHAFQQMRRVRNG